MPSIASPSESAEAFWKPWERHVSSFASALSVIHGVFDRWSEKGKRFAWRGQADSSWPLHSSLYRRLLWSRAEGSPPDEEQLRAEEHEILVRAHRWGLHTGQTGRLSVLNQLAVLQHYGAPTRLIDVTFNPLIGLWFAVAEQWANGERVHEDADGRLFAIDVTDRLINEEEELRDWEDDLDCPWPSRPSENGWADWTTRCYAWKPPRLDHRIAAQNGGFLIGGVPNAGIQSKPSQWRKTPKNRMGHWSIEEVRCAVSVPLRVNKMIRSGRGGGAPQKPVFTLRIKHSAKADIRKHLQDLYGYQPSTIYPDYSGFALYGRPELRSRKPD